MSDTALNKIIQYGTAAERAAFVPDPAVGSQVLYLWYDTDSAPDTYAWDGSNWVQINSSASGIDELTGDVTAGPGSGSQVATIANDAVTTIKILDANVTLAKIADASANDKLLGSGNAGSGAPYTEITLGTNLSMSGTTLNASGSGGGTETFITESDETGSLPNSLQLIAGTNITFDTSTPNQLEINATDTDTGINQLTGDVTAGPGNGSQVATIANSAVTNAKLANMADQTIKGNDSGGAAAPQDLSANEVSVVLDGATDPFVRTSDLPAAGITQLTGEVTAGPGSGSQAATIANNAVVTAKILDANVTDAKISNRTAVSVFGRSVNIAGVGADIAAAANDTLLARTANTVAFQQLTVGMIPDTTIIPAKLTAAAKTGVIGWTIDGGGSPITTGLKAIIRVPVAVTINRWSILADQNGNIEFDIFNDAPGTTYPPTTSIVAAAPPELTGGASDFGDSTTLTAWTTSITANNCMQAEVVSTSGTIERVTLELEYTRS